MNTRTSGIAFLILLSVWLVVGVSWATNLYKLANCDFVAPYRCEAIHGIGLVPPAAVVAVWFKSDL